MLIVISLALLTLENFDGFAHMTVLLQFKQQILEVSGVVCLVSGAAPIFKN